MRKLIGPALLLMPLLLTAEPAEPDTGRDNGAADADQGADKVDVWIVGPGERSCREFLNSTSARLETRMTDPHDIAYLNYFHGFVAGYDWSAERPISGPSRTRTWQWLRAYCEVEPDSPYADAVVALVNELTEQQLRER